MSAPEIGKPAPDFELPATGEQQIGLSRLRGKRVVLYFYPRDNTPGCTREGQAFRDLMDEFTRADAVVLGISRDSVASHEKFREKQAFPFDLLADREEIACTRYGVIKEKNMYGKKVLGVERSTFLIDDQGVLRAEWRKVKVDGHAEAVLAALKAL